MFVEWIGVRPAIKIKSEFGWIMSTIALSNDRPPYYLGTLDSGKITPQTNLYLAVATTALP